MGDVLFQIFLAVVGIFVGILSQLVEPFWQKIMLLVFGSLLFLTGGLWAGFVLGNKPVSLKPKLRAQTSSKDTRRMWWLVGLLLILVSGFWTVFVWRNSFKGFDFESGTQGWLSSEAGDKNTVLKTTKELVYSGRAALMVETELFGSGSVEFATHDKKDVYRHTEALAYLSDSVPQGYDLPGPYNLTTRTFSCSVYLPNGLVANNSPTAYVRLFAKDSKFANIYSEAMDITQSTVDHWMELSLLIETSPDSDFDPAQTNALGVRIDSHDGSPVQYVGPFYIDRCSIK